MNPKNIVKLLQKAFDQPEYNLESIITEDEKVFSSHLEVLIKDSIGNSFFVETYDSLDFEDTNQILEPCAIVDGNDNNDDLIEIEGNLSFNLSDNTFSRDIEDNYKQKAVEYWKSGKIRKLKLKTVQSKFNRVTSNRQLYRWEKQISNGGNRIEKLKEISEFVLNRFNEAVEKSVTVHDLDLRRWALQARDKISFPSRLFNASTKWVHMFKQKHRIVSRKINKFVTKKSIENKEKLEQDAKTFVEKIKTHISLVGEENVLNSDQSGFNLEMHTGRTLALKGQEIVEALTQSVNSMTHSYTIQPLISAKGVLLSPLLIVLQEKNDTFGPIVKKSLFEPENVHVLASKSGKLTSNLVRKWFEENFLPVSNKKPSYCWILGVVKIKKLSKLF